MFCLGVSHGSTTPEKSFFFEQLRLMNKIDNEANWLLYASWEPLIETVEVFDHCLDVSNSVDKFFTLTYVLLHTSLVFILIVLLICTIITTNNYIWYSII